MATQYAREKKDYITVLTSDGSMREIVTEDTPGAIRREYEDSKGNAGVKYEKLVESISGKITNISFFDTTFGKLIQLEVTDPFLADDVKTLSLDTDMEWGKDLMHKLPNLDLEKVVTIRSYKYQPKGKTTFSKGLDIKQDGEKVKSFFTEWIDNNPVNTNGFPDFTDDKGKKLTHEEGKALDRDDKNIQFTKQKKFLIKYTTENFVSKFDKALVEEKLDEEFKIPEDY